MAGDTPVPGGSAQPVQHDPAGLLVSVVIPVFNSEGIVATTIRNVIDVFESHPWRYEIILVDDGSTDRSWDVIEQAATAHRHVQSYRLLKNYGQHAANLCGLRASRGDFVVTMDDDMQNPPSEIPTLVNAALQGHDVVFGKFRHKQHGRYRRVGSRLIGVINRRIFGQPDDLIVSNFRILNRDVVDRICSARTAFPYITGQALLYSQDRANVDVDHHRREIGSSNYSIGRMLKLVARITFSYSSYPLRLVSLWGMTVAAFAFALSIAIIAKALVRGNQVEGWASLAVMISFFSGIIIAMLAMIGEYVVRALNQLSNEPYYVSKHVGTEASTHDHPTHATDDGCEPPHR